MSRLAHAVHGSFVFFFNDTATTEIYTLSLHDALPISPLSTSILSPSQAGLPLMPGYAHQLSLGYPTTVGAASSW